MNVLRKIGGPALLAATALAASGCGPEGPGPGGGPVASASCNDDTALFKRLATVEHTLAGASSREEFNDILRASYTELQGVADVAGQPVASASAGARVACLTTSAQALTVMSFLPPSEQAALIADGATPPGIAARERLSSVLNLCRGAMAGDQSLDDARRCAIATLLQGAGVSQAAAGRLDEAAHMDAAPSTDDWRELAGVVSAFGESADGWAAVSDAMASLPGASEDEASQLAGGYLPRIACSIYVDGANLVTRPRPQADAELTAAVNGFDAAFQTSLASAAAGLELPLAAPAAQACAADADGDACGSARRESLSNACARLWLGDGASG